MQPPVLISFLTMWAAHSQSVTPGVTSSYVVRTMTSPLPVGTNENHKNPRQILLQIDKHFGMFKCPNTSFHSVHIFEDQSI